MGCNPKAGPMGIDHKRLEPIAEESCKVKETLGNHKEQCSLLGRAMFSIQLRNMHGKLEADLEDSRCLVLLMTFFWLSESNSQQKYD
jgi:hypothetical protein